MHPVSLNRFKAQAREAGAAAPMPKRLGLVGADQVDDAVGEADS